MFVPVMHHLHLGVVPMCALTSFCLMVICFCCKRSSWTNVRKRTRERVVSGGSLFLTMDNPNSEVSCCPHPFLPPSIYDIGPDGISVTENVHGGLDTPTSLGPQPMTALMRQESCSHRNCELPPVPDGSDPKPVHHPSAKMPLQHAVIDEQQSESDGLYASVGHSGSTAIRDSAVPHRTSVVDSVHAPYYSSVSSMIAPNEYGDTSEDSVLRFHSHPTPQTSQIDNLYARVKPRFERAPVSGRLPREPNAPFVHAQTSAPGCSSAGPESSQPPLPERGYDQCEIGLVNRNRTFRTYFGSGNHSGTVGPSSTSSNQLNVRSVFFPATTQHNVVPLPFISPPPEPLPDGNNYGKISVRESLASLRARKAFPILEMSPFGEHPPPNITLTGQSEYEHVSGSASDTNNSTYEFTPQPTVYSGVRAFEAYATHGDIQDEQHLSDAYAELPDTVAAPDAGPSENNQISTRLQNTAHVSNTLTTNTLEPHLQRDSVSHQLATPVTVDSRQLRSTPLHASRILAEMKAFRHMDSEGIARVLLSKHQYQITHSYVSSESRSFMSRLKQWKVFSQPAAPKHVGHQLTLSPLPSISVP
ncbi:hypothetical protein T265_04818 [Opisthorchis viverrini]|uniref:Uncharacterized protein n=1 Tax=Opisthorchis viverrini TaxID=6198 RepID=A0A074ZRB5_OPIVI|nr:hypothetical protein T265_04818 [Opisthorchis viverrini]KER28362.1 hypothetical protein T265_04818 [Opisthorchis viverrini]